MGELVESALANIAPAAVTELFLILITAVFVFAFYQGLQGRHSVFLEHAPSLMTSMGILGTFVGIVIGLLGFDVQQLDASIPQLLAGLKTAFITSLAGLTYATVFKGADSFYFAQKRKEAEVAGDVGPEEIYKALERQSKQLDELKHALAGNEEGSLVGQMKLLRSDVQDFSRLSREQSRAFEERLWEELQSFAELLSKAATEQVIEALKQVIVEFNQNLIEQFGDNFKELNAAVERLVTWQDQYAKQLDHMIDQYQQGVSAIGATKDAVEGIHGECKNIPSVMLELKETLEVNQHQIAELSRHLEAFVQMRDKAVEAVPIMNEHLTKVGTDLSAGAEKIHQTMLEGAQHFGDSVGKTTEAMNRMVQETTGASEELTQTLKDSSEQLNATTRDMLARLEEGARDLQTQLDEGLRSTIEAVERSVEQSLTGLDAQVRSLVDQSGESLNRSLEGLEEATSREINRVMSEMGQALASISGQFSQDYRQLVAQMHQIAAAHNQQ